MRKIIVSLMFLFIISACSHEEDIDTKEDKSLSSQHVEVPSEIFTSEKQNSVIDEEEMKQSIKTYLDSHEELDNASSPFQDIIYEGKELNEEELEKFAQITKLTKENDENFTNYLSNNTLPEDYQVEAERISQYITAYNEVLYELDEILRDFSDDGNKGEFPKVDILSIMTKMDVVNGREQKTIEDFLEKKEIKTKAFGRDNN
nr:NDxxF motif lipoprotein [Ornithinibacillus scapharcae]